MYNPNYMKLSKRDIRIESCCQGGVDRLFWDDDTLPYHDCGNYMTIYICETLSNYTVKLVRFIICKLYINTFNKGGEERGGAGTPSPPLSPPGKRVTLSTRLSINE